MKPLTEEQEARLIIYYRFAIRLARPYIRRCPWREHELESAAGIGLWQAASTFAEGRGYDFSTHARWCVRGALIEVFRCDRPKGYRKGSSHGEAVLPEVLPLGEVIASDEGSVGWEVDYEDEVEGLSRHVADPVDQYLFVRINTDASTPTLKAVGAAFGRSEWWAWNRYRVAIGQIAARVAGTGAARMPPHAAGHGGGRGDGRSQARRSSDGRERV